MKNALSTIFTGLGIFVLAGAAFAGYQFYRAHNEGLFEVISYKMKKLTATEGLILMTIKLMNPIQVAYTVHKFDIDVIANGDYILTLDNEPEEELDPGDTATVTVPITFEPMRVIGAAIKQDISNIFVDKEKVEFRFKGTVNVSTLDGNIKNIGVPVDVTYNLKELTEEE